MSLLNDMLKDLNNRTPSASAPLTLPPLNSHRTKIQISLICCAVAIILLPALIYCITGSPSRPTKKVASVIISPEVSTTRLSESENPLANARGSDTSNETMIEAVKADNNIQLLSQGSTYAERFDNTETAFTPLNSDMDNIKQDDTQEEVFTPVEKKITLTPEEWHDEHLNKAFEAIEDGNEPRAIQLLTTILTQFPASIEVRENLAALYIAQNELNLAYDTLNKGLEFEPHSFRLLTMKSRLLIEQGQYREALALLEQFKPDIRKEPDYYGVLAALFETLGRSNEAGSLYQSLVKIEPSKGQYWLGYAIALENKNANKQAIEAYKRASESDDAQPAVRAYAETRLKTLQG